MNTLWIKISLAGLIVLAVAVACTPRAFEPGVYHPDGHPDETVSFGPDGTYVFTNPPGNMDVDDLHGYYRVSGNKVILSDGPHCDVDDGSYTWGFDGKSLKLTVLHDGQRARDEMLTTAALLLNKIG